MSTISTYIWGIRYGFKVGEALFPERTRLDAAQLKEYETVVKHFGEDKDTKFRFSTKDFYFLLRDEQYRYYSLVISDHTDIAGRKAYLVFTLVCGRNKVIKGDIITALQNLKKLYKTKNKEYEVDRNLFTQEHVNEQLLGLGLEDAGTKTQASETLVLYNEGELNYTHFNAFGGNNVYFIPEGSNAEMIAGIGLQKSLRLSEELGKARERQNARAEFIALWAVKNEQNYKQLKELLLRCKDALDATSIANFNEWEKTLQQQNILDNNIEKLKSELVKAQQNNFSGDPSTALLLLNSTPKIKDLFSDSDLDLIKQWQVKWEQKTEADLLAQIKLELERARKQGFKYDPKQVDDLIKKYKLKNSLPATLAKDIETWQAEYKKFSIAELKSNIIELADEIKNARRKIKLANESTWVRKINEYKLKADILNDKSIKNDEAFEFLINEKWRPSKWPVLKIAVASTVLVVLLGAGVYYKDEIKGYMTKDKENNSKNDCEGYDKNKAGYDKLMKEGQKLFDDGNEAFAKTKFEKAKQNADAIKKNCEQGKEEADKLISEAQGWIKKCNLNNPKGEATPSSPDKNKDPQKQNPAAPKEPAPQPSEPKTSGSKGDKQVVVSEDEARKKAEEEAKKKAEEKKKEEAKKKSANGANAADEYWSKVKLVGGKYRGSKEEAVELFKNAPLQYPNLKANQDIYNAVEGVKERS